jgi:hypothetical protein
MHVYINNLWTLVRFVGSIIASIADRFAVTES